MDSSPLHCRTKEVVIRDSDKHAKGYLGVSGPIPILVAVFAVAGALLAALVTHRLPSPVILPNRRENDGSLALAFVVFGVPISGWLLWIIGGIRLLGIAAAIGGVVFLVALFGLLP